MHFIRHFPFNLDYLWFFILLVGFSKPDLLLLTVGKVRNKYITIINKSNNSKTIVKYRHNGDYTFYLISIKKKINNNNGIYTFFYAPYNIGSDAKRIHFPKKALSIFLFL